MWKGVEAPAEIGVADIPEAINQRRDQRRQRKDEGGAKAGGRAWNGAQHDIVVFRLGAQADRQNSKKRHPPDDEVDGESLKEGLKHYGSQ